MGVKKFLAIGLVASAVSSLSYADGPDFQAGVGLFDQNLNFDQNVGADVDADATGFSFQARSLFSEHFALGVALQYAPYVSVSSGDNSRRFDSAKTTTLYSNLLITTGIDNNSLYAFTGVGYFSDHWKLDGESGTAQGLQLPLGIGYQFQKAAIELQVQLRDPASYDSEVDRATNFSFSVLGSF